MIALACLFASAACVLSPETAEIVLARDVVELSGSQWTLTEPDGGTAVVSVPHSWNVEDGCDGKGVLASERYVRNSSCASSYERKRVVYARALPDPRPGRRYFVRCEGASITATVSVNGRCVGEHIGAFTAFCFEVTDALKPSGNRLEIAVDNFSRDDVAPPVNADFTMYGGLCRKVWLVETPQVCIDPTRDGGSGVRIFPNPETGEVRAEIAVSGGADETRTFAVPDFRLWSPETPVVYTQRFEIASGDAVVETFGFRKVEFRSDGFYLNGVRRQLRGVNYHQDREGRGWAVSDGERAQDIAAIKELGADAVRTAHYPHSGRTYSLCDEAGLLAWCEQPNVNGLRFSETFRSNVWRQTREMVVQLGNHPSIFCWSIFNELYNKVPMNEGEPEAMMEELRDYVKTLDPERPVAAASDMVDNARLNRIPDVLGFNRYPGWYGGAPSDMSERVDEIFSKNPSLTTIAMSEYGAGGDVASQGDALAPCAPKSDFHSEGYQAFVHSEDYRALASDPRVWGAFVWCLFDFGSDCRLEGRKWGRNDKGLIAFDHVTKKAAWHFYHANWSADPELHLVGASGEHQTTNATLNVLGFSNLGDVELRVNGRSVGVKTPDAVKTVLWRDLPLSVGVNAVELRSGGRVSRASWRRVPALNSDPGKIGEVRLGDPLAFADAARDESAEMRLTGPFGDRLDRMISHHVEATDANLLADVFAGRTREPWWQTEFWGKYMHSVVPFWKYTGSAKLKANIDAGVSRVLASQEGCGYIGNYQEDARCARGWDVWGMKYTMMGLLHHYDGTGDARSLEAAKRLCDFLIGELGPGGRKNVPIFKTGGWGGLPSCSVLEPVVWLYNRTKEKRYLEFADHIVRQACSDPDGPRLLTQADVPVADRRLASAPKEWTPRNWHQIRDLTKAYEMMSCYQGLLEYYEATGKGEYLDAAVKTAESIATTEINLAGGAAARELWYRGREQQVRHLAWQQETCVTITWMRLCEKLLAVTGDPKWADRMEHTFYNAYLAALNLNCDHFASYTPLAGYKSLGHWHCGMHTDCCNANGPRGYLSMLNAFVSSTGDVFTVNFYMSGNARAKLAGSEGVAHFEMHTFYPKLDTVNLWYRSREDRTFALRLRIPAFSSQTSVKVNGRPADAPVNAGSYFEIRRKWSAGDKVELVIDMPVEVHRNGDYVAFTRGPVCLARDTRFGDDAIDDDVRVSQITPEVLKSFALVRPPTTDMFMAMSAALPCGCHAENPDAGALPATVHFTDFASAGNSWQPRDRYQVWLPTLVDIKDEPR